MNILIVDDDQTNRKLLRSILGAEGHGIFEAGDGLEALQTMREEKVDLLISDGLMPNMDGYRLCTEVRANEKFNQIPFIFYTSTFTSRGDETLALRIGADRFLTKPVPLNVLLESIRQVTGQPRCVVPRANALVDEMEITKQYGTLLIRKLEKRNEELAERTASLHASETRLRTLFAASPDCVQVLGRDGRTTEINAAGLDLFEAVSLEKIAAKPLREFVTAMYQPAFQSCVEAVWRGQKDSAEFEIEGLQGGRHWVEMHAAPLFDPNGQVVSLLGILRDNTARKELEEQFVQAQKMEVVGQLAGGVAHDFNNMIGIMMGYSELILSSPDTSRLQEFATTIFQTGERAATLTRQLLLFSRQEAPCPRLLDLSELISGLDRMLERLIGENTKLVALPDPNLGHIEADARQIEQVLMNLTVNARDAMQGDGTITIETSNVTILDGDLPGANIPAGDYVLLSVADTGKGMSDEVKSKIFKAFFTTKPAGQGTGLGLATCQKIVNQWRGHILVESEVGVGTTFRIYFPRVAHSACSPAAATAKGPLPRGFETILLVEDEPGLRNLAASVLQKQGYTVLRAGNGQEALRIVRDRHGRGVDLVVTDMVMPEMGGKVMAEWLRATNPEIKILFTSGYTDCGLDGTLDADIEFLPKPYPPSRLVRRVREVIDAAARPA